MYKSPIELSVMDDFVGNTIKQIVDDRDEQIYQCISAIGVHVDKEELIKALSYDRDQYNAGYRDAMATIVRCKECIHFYESDLVCLKIYSDGNVSSDAWQTRKPDDYCSYGERKGESDG